MVTTLLKLEGPLEILPARLSFFLTWEFPGSSIGKESAYSSGDLGSIPGLGRSPGERYMATHSSILAWKIPCPEEPGGLQSMGWQELDTT